MRQLNEMFHIDGEQLIKTSNGEPVPEDEPLFILRGRDAVATITIAAYMIQCDKLGVPEDRMAALRQVWHKFAKYAERKGIESSRLNARSIKMRRILLEGQTPPPDPDERLRAQKYCSTCGVWIPGKDKEFGRHLRSAKHKEANDKRLGIR